MGIQLALISLLLLQLGGLSLARNEKAAAWKDHQVVPDVVVQEPKSILSVKYGDLTVDHGNKLTPTQVREPPKICWDSDPDKLYVISMVDPDAPSKASPKAREWNHLLIGNVPGSQACSGDTLKEYMGAAPPPGSGLHRYVFLVYEQTDKITYTEADKNAGRAKFNIAYFSERYNLSVRAVAGNFFQAQAE